MNVKGGRKRKRDNEPPPAEEHQPDLTPAVPQPPAEDLFFPEELIYFPDNDEEHVHGFWDADDDNLDEPDYPTDSTSSSDSN
ncbi:hypothetical protein V6N13_028322 [Hibiscus sabdariffa]